MVVYLCDGDSPYPLVSATLCPVSIYSTLLKMAVYQGKKRTIKILLG